MVARFPTGELVEAIMAIAFACRTEDPKEFEASIFVKLTLTLTEY